MSMPNFDNITSLLTTFLDVQSRRSEVVAGNLANADTPGYKAKELDFSQFLSRAAESALAPGGRPSPEAWGSPGLIEQAGGVEGLDGNTVDTAREMTTLAEAGLKYLTGTQLLQSRMRTLRAAIREGR
jgi:flagellar basal-body rod protein FlgB